MPLLDQDPIDPEIAATLDAIDATLAGEPVDGRYADIAEIALLLASDRPQVPPAFAQSMDQKVERRFAAMATDRPRRRRYARFWEATGAVAAGVALIVAIVVVAGGGHGGSLGASSSASESVTSAAASSSAGSAGSAAASAPSTNSARRLTRRRRRACEGAARAGAAHQFVNGLRLRVARVRVSLLEHVRPDAPAADDRSQGRSGGAAQPDRLP